MLKFKENFALGVASASTQIEGGEVDSNWYRFCEEGHVKDGSHCKDATMHYELFAQDNQLMAEMGIKHSRISLEWARINPELGQFDLKVLNHYRVELLLMKELGIKPLVTFYHFSHPIWFEELGAFTKKENTIYFLEYISECLKAFGDLVDEFVTINEPNVFATLSYLYGEWPPMQNNLHLALETMNVLALCHIKAYQLIHTIFDKHRAVKVGFAHHGRAFVAKNTKNPLQKAAAKVMAKSFQGELIKAFMKGEFNLPMRNLGQVEPGLYCDFIGINYYTRSVIDQFREVVSNEYPHNDLGWEIYPEGLIEVVQESYDCVPLPIYITENGTCDNHDQFRSRYIYDHLKVIMDSDLPIERYYHWCFVDNFEWKEGVSARFGLVHNDFETQQRTIKESGQFYSQMIQDHGVTQECYQRFVEKQTYHD